MKKLVRPEYLKKTGYNIFKGESIIDGPSIQNTARIEKYQHLGNKKLFPQSYGNTLGPPDSVRTETKTEAVSLKKDFNSN